MSDLVTATTLNAARRAVNRTLTWRGTIARSGLVTPCRISYDTRSLRIDHTPGFLRIPRWKLTMQDGIDLRAADQVLVEKQQPDTSWATVGTYLALEMMNPTTISASTAAFAVQAADASGSMALFTNTDVVFRNVTKNGDAALPASVFIYETTPFMSLAGGAPFYDWTVISPSSLVFSPSGESIDANDTIGWSRFGMDAGLGEPYGRPLTKPKPYPGLLPLSIAYFKETPGKAS